MSKISKFYNKHKDSVLIGVGIIAILGTVIGIYEVVNRPKVIKVEDSALINTEHQLAEHILVGNDSGLIKLISVSNGKEIGTKNIRQVNNSSFIYSNAKDFKKIYAYGAEEKKFFEITVKDSKISAKTLVDMKNNAIKISNFKVDGDSVYFISPDNMSLNKVSIQDGSIKNIPVKEAVENWVVTGEYFVYSTNTKIYSANMANGKIAQIDTGDKTTGLFFANGEVIDFNKFGSTKNTSIMLRINPADLIIKNMVKFDTANVEGLTNDSEDKNIYVEEVVNKNDKPTQTINSVKLDKTSKSNIEIVTNKDVSKYVYNQNNTMTAKGYLYSLVDNNIEIIDTESKQVIKTIKVDDKVFMPVMK